MTVENPLLERVHKAGTEARLKGATRVPGFVRAHWELVDLAARIESIEKVHQAIERAGFKITLGTMRNLMTSERAKRREAGQIVSYDPIVNTTARGEGSAERAAVVPAAVIAAEPVAPVASYEVQPLIVESPAAAVSGTGEQTAPVGDGSEAAAPLLQNAADDIAAVKSVAARYGKRNFLTGVNKS